MVGELRKRSLIMYFYQVFLRTGSGLCRLLVTFTRAWELTSFVAQSVPQGENVPLTLICLLACICTWLMLLLPSWLRLDDAINLPG